MFEVLALMAAVLTFAVSGGVTGQATKAGSASVSATLTDGDGVTVEVSDLKGHYYISTRIKKGPEQGVYWDLSTLYVTLSGQQGASYWTDTLSFGFSELKRLSYEPQTNISQKDRPRLELEKRDGSVYVITGNHFEQRNASGERIKEFAITRWEYGGKIGGDEASLNSFVGHTQTPLGRPGEFSINEGAVRQIQFRSLARSGP
jgi:hypothetical protein